ncbi:hypothetical protein BCR36DRAFT_322483 [Piromyces finnis]|uniref:DH domain-containing protein n=1 Tax=Piromyces finnis TaxID=1754191 RepID=A0A1Y1VG72_9FUNG|nr:hypothetical protein BCR36DRAFT_322483 [Piromyces finnis]|eukprot:ORX54191.1 hypothetical protein BCR36DRAFT_322483 [Piromyces finnis]
MKNYSGADELSRVIDDVSKMKRNNSESEAIYKGRIESNETRLCRDNSSKSEITLKKGYDRGDTRVRRLNSGNSNNPMNSSNIMENGTDSSVNDGKILRSDMVMEIGIPHGVSHKKSKSNGDGIKLQKPKSSAKLRKISSPIRPSQGFNHFRGELNNPIDTYNKYSQESRKNSSSTDRVQSDKRKDGLYDISTNIVDESEPSSNYVTPLNYQPELPFNPIKMDSPKNIINVSDSNSISQTTNKNDISFPLPPTSLLNSQKSLTSYDNVHVKSSSFGSEEKLEENDSSNISRNLKNRYRANSLKTQRSDSAMNKHIGIPKSFSNSSINNLDSNIGSTRYLEPQVMDDDIGEDMEFNNFNNINRNDQLNDNSFSVAPNNKLLKLKNTHRNTIIVPSDYLHNNKSTTFNNINNKEMLTKKIGSEPILYNNLKGEQCDIDIQKIIPNGLTKKGSLDSLNKSIVNRIVGEDESGTGKIFHPVRSHSLHANKMFNGLTLTDVPDENGVVHKLVTKKSSSSLNETNKNQNYLTNTTKIPTRYNTINDRFTDRINRCNSVSSNLLNKNHQIPERNNTIDSKMYLNTKNSDSNKKIYEQLYKRNNPLTEDIEAARKVVTSEFEINDKDLFKKIDDSDIQLTENPLLSSNPIFVMCPNLIDAISTSIPIDAYDFSDDEDEDEPPTPLCLESDEDFDPTEGLHSEPRGYVVANLYETEKNYLSDLYTLNNFFKEKLKNIISPITLNSIFEGVDDLLELHKRFYKSLHKVVCNWNKNSLVGKLFIEYRNDWQIYQNFIDNYARSLDAIRREEETNPQFRQFMKDCLTSTETNRKSLKEYLMFPVQRTTRYSLIIKDLIKFIDQTHPDYEDLSLALKEMTLLATKVNEVKRREEETTSMFTAFEQTENCPPTIITHKRRLIYQIDVLDVLNKNHRPMHIFLFSDLFMLTKNTRNVNNTTTNNIISHPLIRALRSHSKQIYRYIRCIDYRDISIEEDDQYRQKNIVRLILNFKKDRYTNNFYNNMNKDLMTSSNNGNNNFPIPSGTTFTSHDVPDSEYTLYCFQFIQYDADKQYRKFVLALKALKEGKDIDWITED